MNPMEAMKFKRPVLEPRGGPAPQDVARIIGIADGVRKVQLAVLAFTGCRAGELQRLQHEDVDIKTGWIRIVSRDGAETKSGYSRSIPIHPLLRQFLETVPATVGPWLFCAPASKRYPRGGHQISTKRLNEDFLSLLKKVGLKAGRDTGFTIHSLRHAFETISVNAGIPQRVIDTWLGHRSDRSMASIYYRLTDEESQRFMQQVPFVLGEPAAEAGD
jgi:integrase